MSGYDSDSVRDSRTRHRPAAGRPHSAASAQTALCAAIPAWCPLLPGLMRRGRSASVILTSPPLRAAEVRITPAPLRRRKVEEEMRRNRNKKKAGVLSVPMTGEGAKQNQCRVTAEGAQGAALPRGAARIQHRVCGPRKPASSAGDTGEAPPKPGVSPVSPHSPLSAPSPTRGRAARATVDSGTTLPPAPAENNHPERRHPGATPRPPRGNSPGRRKGSLRPGASDVVAIAALAVKR